MKVPAQVIEIAPEDRDSIVATIGSLLSVGKLSGGEHVDALEAEFAEYVGARSAIAVSSGTAALELILLAHGVAGRTVIVPANTNFATFVAARRAGAIVALCDVNPATLAPDLEHITAVTADDTAAVILVHMGGIITAEISRIAQWCEQSGIALLEDAAHAHGSHRDGRAAGTVGLAGAYSFFATKVMTSGEGGMVVTDDPHLAAEVRMYRNLGKESVWVSRHIRMGFNARMTEISAVIARHQLRRLDEYVTARQRIADRYSALLAATPDVRIIAPGHAYSGYKVVAMVNERLSRAMIKERMARSGVQLAGEVYAEPLHHQPVLRDAYTHVSLPGAELSCAYQICLPIYPSLDDERIDYVAEVLKSVLYELRRS